jgi:hypothetical protein
MSNKFTLLRDHSEGNISQMMKSNGFEYLFLEEEKREEPKFDKQTLLVGSGAKQKFWELYKSERHFKDFKPKQKITDPRFAYFQTCKDLKIQPKAGLLIKDKENPYIDFENQFMKSNSSVEAVAAAVKRYNYVVLGVKFVNNSMNSRQVKIIIDSFSHHYGSLLNINLSENNVGLEGSRHLAA